MSPAQFIAWREAFGGRRFLLTVGAGVVDTLLLWFEKIDQATYSNLTLWTVAAYITGATVQKVKGYVSPPPNNAPADSGPGPSARGDGV